MVRSVALLFAAMMSAVAIPAQQQAKEPAKRIPVSIAVESEGPQGLWSQYSKDLSKVQLQELKQLVSADVSRQQDVSLVDASDPKDHLHLAIVVARLDHAAGTSWFVASSVVTIAESKGDDVLATHDVIAGPDLQSLAHSVGFQLASTKLRLALRMVK
jgi:hypothetical protein